MSPTVSGSVGVLVLGMHRSGTSMLTRVLSLLGCALPHNLLGAHETNPTGHWESLDAVDINDELLAGLGRRWDDLRELPVDWLDRPETQAAGEKIKVLLEREFAGKPLWVLKDPRMCRLAPLWLAKMAELGMDARVSIPVRHPQEVSDSLAWRNGMEHGRSQLLWLQHLVEAERASRGLPRTFLRFQALVDDWRSEALRMGRELHLDWPVALDAVADEIDRFVDPDLQHAHADGAAARAPGGHLADVVGDLYDKLAASPTTAWKQIARCDASLAPARSLYAPAVEVLARAVERSDRHAAEVDALLTSQLADRKNLVVGSDEVRLLREQAYDILARIEQNGPLVVELVKQIEAQRDEFGRLGVDLADGSQAGAARMDTLHSAVQAQQAAAERLAAQGHQVSERIDALAAELAAAWSQERASLAGESKAAHAEAAALRAELLAAQARAREASDASRAADARFREEVEALRAAEAHSGEQADALRAELARARDEAGALRAAQARARDEMEALRAAHAAELAAQRAQSHQATEVAREQASAALAALQQQRLADAAGHGERLERLVQSLRDASATLAATQVQLAAVAGQRDQLDAELARARDAAITAGESVRTLERRAAEQDEAWAIERMRHGIDRDALASAERERGLLKRAAELGTVTATRIEGELRDAQATARALREQAAARDAEITALAATLDETRRQRDALSAQVDAARQSLAMHVEQVSALESSTSWRLTAPLRSTVRFLRRLSG